MAEVFFCVKKVGTHENEKCFYGLQGPLGKWARLGDDFDDLSHTPTNSLKAKILKVLKLIAISENDCFANCGKTFLTVLYLR